VCTSTTFCCSTVQLGATAELGEAADFSQTAFRVLASALNSTSQPPLRYNSTTRLSRPRGPGGRSSHETAREQLHEARPLVDLLASLTRVESPASRTDHIFSRRGQSRVDGWTSLRQDHGRKAPKLAVPSRAASTPSAPSKRLPANTGSGNPFAACACACACSAAFFASRTTRTGKSAPAPHWRPRQAIICSAVAPLPHEVLPRSSGRRNRFGLQFPRSARLN
jgi:hypothetical protein